MSRNDRFFRFWLHKSQQTCASISGFHVKVNNHCILSSKCFRRSNIQCDMGSKSHSLFRFQQLLVFVKFHYNEIVFILVRFCGMCLGDGLSKRRQSKIKKYCFIVCLSVFWVFGIRKTGKIGCCAKKIDAKPLNLTLYLVVVVPKYCDNIDNFLFVF